MADQIFMVFAKFSSPKPSEGMSRDEFVAYRLKVHQELADKIKAALPEITVINIGPLHLTIQTDQETADLITMCFDAIVIPDQPVIPIQELLDHGRYDNE